MKSETGYTFILYRISIEYGEHDEDEKRILNSSHTLSNSELNHIIREVVSEIFKNNPNVKIVGSRVIKREDGCIEYIGYLMIAGVNWLVTGDIPDYIIQEFSSNVVQDVKICLLGDVTGDGKVNTKDWARLKAHVNETSNLTGYELACGDVNGDSKVNIKDWARLKAHVNESNPLW